MNHLSIIFTLPKFSEETHRHTHIQKPVQLPQVLYISKIRFPTPTAPLFSYSLFSLFFLDLQYVEMFYLHKYSYIFLKNDDTLCDIFSKMKEVKLKLKTEEVANYN